ATGTPVLYAGVGAAADEVAGAGLGQAVAHDEQAVGEALVAAFVEPPTPERRAALASWTREHASLAQVGADAARGALQSAGLPVG
ncbi:MAG: glycosyltransferase WbuB, partial [Angustibacter sp.]